MNFRRLVENNAIAFVAPLQLEDHRGFDTITLVARLAWEIDVTGAAKFASKQRPIRVAEQYRESGSVHFPSDACANKPGTDVIMLGHAHPPADGKKHSHVDVSLRVDAEAGPLSKTVRVFGPRVFINKSRKILPGPAANITEPLPLIYEHAAGGTSEDGDEHDSVNPVGVGFGNPAAWVGKEAYRIEVVEGHEPAGFGPIARAWSPRKELYGTMDEAYFKRRHPVAPKDFDPRHNCPGHPDLWSETPLRGDERVLVIGATPEGQWSFQLPYYAPCFHVHDGSTEPVRHDPHLDTILIDLEDPGQRIVEQTWRCVVRVPKKVAHIQKIVVANGHDVPREYYTPVWERIHSAS